jgi:hypothetical protein
MKFLLRFVVIMLAVSIGLWCDKIAAGYENMKAVAPFIGVIVFVALYALIVMVPEWLHIRRSRRCSGG